MLISATKISFSLCGSKKNSHTEQISVIFLSKIVSPKSRMARKSSAESVRIHFLFNPAKRLLSKKSLEVGFPVCE